MTSSASDSRVIVAVDTSNRQQALELVRVLRSHVAGFKIGLELLMAEGPGLVSELSAMGDRVFVDGKFMDIPTTVSAAVQSVCRLGAWMVNVHCSGGRAMLSAAARAVREYHGQEPAQRPLVLGVTVLTSLTDIELRDDIGIADGVDLQVKRLAMLAATAGLDGVIASPLEVASLRTHVDDKFLIVTPGVRPSWAPTNDQARVMSPGRAIRAGANYVVIGRPITRPPTEIGTPLEAVIRVNAEIAGA